MTLRLAEPKDVGKRGKMNPDRAAIVAAKRIGCTTEEYRTHWANGEKWCKPCGKWLSIEEFNVDCSRTDGRASRCRPCQREYLRDYWRSETCADCGVACMGGRCESCYAARAARRQRHRETLRPYKRLVWAVVIAARLHRRWTAMARRLFVGLARLACQVERKRSQAMRAQRRSHWYHRPREVSLDGPLYGSDAALGEVIPSADEHDPQRVAEANELRQLLGGIDLDDVARMDDETLNWLRWKLSDAGYGPGRMTSAARDEAAPTRRVKMKRTRNLWETIHALGGIDDDSEYSHECVGSRHSAGKEYRQRKEAREYARSAAART